MEVIFKPIEAIDVPVVIGMMEDFYAIDNYPMDTEVSKSLLIQFIQNESLGKSWLILMDGQPAGYVILTFVFSFEYKGRIAFLDELFITEKARGLGLGKKAVEFIQEQAKLYSVKIVYLEIEPHNERAQELYLSKNFALHNRKLMKYVIT